MVLVLAVKMPSSWQCLRNTWLKSQTSWVQVLPPLPISCVTLGKRPNF